MDVRLPDGTVVKNVPEGTTQAELVSRLQAGGYDVSKLTGAPAKAAAPTPRPVTPEEPTPAVNPEFGGFMEALQPPEREEKPRKKYTGSVLDTVPPEILQEKRPFTREEGLLLSQRDFAEAKPKRRETEVRAAPPELPERSMARAATDVGLALMQGGVGFFKGIADNINAGENPASAALDLVDEGLQYLKSPQTKLSTYQRQLKIDQIQRLQGEMGAASYAARSLLSPAGADVVARGAGSILPSYGLSLLQIGAKGLAAANLLSNAGDAAKESAEALRKLTPEQWSNSDAYQELRAKGLSHKDSVSILAPIFALPSQGVGALTGYVSGKTGIEKTLAGEAVRKGAIERGKRALAEIGGEELESVLPKVMGNIVTGAIDTETGALTGVGQLAVETAAGATPGAALAASGRARPEEPVAPPVAPPVAVEPVSPPTTPAERIEPTFEERVAPPTPETGGRIEPTLERAQAAPEAPTEPRMASIAERAKKLKATLPFLSDEEAMEIAKTREARAQVKEEQRAAIEPPIFQQPESGSPQAARLQELFDEALAKGVLPEQATTVAQRQLATELQEAEGETRVAEPVSPPSGEGAGVAGVAPTGAPTERVARAERIRVVPTAEDVGQPAVGEGEQPGAVDERPFEEIIRSTPSETLQTFIDPDAPIAKAYTSGEKKFIREELERRQREAAGAEPDIGNVISMVERRQAQVEEQDEAEWERLEALSIEEGRAKLAETYGPQIKALWPIAQKTKKVLRESQDDKNSLEFQAATRIVRKLDKLLGRFAGLEEETDTNGTRNYFDAALTDIPADLATLDRALTGLQEPAVAPKGKRGRPKAELTPEQRALKAAERGKRSVELTKADRQTKRAVQTIEATTKPLDEGEFESEEALTEARNEQTAQRREAIKSLLQVEAQFRGAAVGNRAKAALQDPKLSQKEVADLRKGMEAMSGAKKAVFKEGVAPVNKALSSAKNANQALAAIISNGSPFQRLVAQRLRGLLNNTRFVVIEEGDPLPEEIKAYEGDWNRANGMFVPPLNAVYVRGASFGRAQGVNNVTALHELLHAATVNKIATGIRRYARDSAEYKKLQQFVGDLVVTSDIAKDVYERRSKAGTVPDEVRRLVERTNGEVFSDPMEFLAYGMTDPDFQLFLMRVPGRLKDETAFSKFVRSIMKLFGIGPGYYSAFSDLVNVTDKILSERVQPSKDGRISRPLLQRDEKLAEQEGIRSAKELRKKAKQAIEGLRRSKTSDLHKNMGALQKIRDQNPVNKALDVIYSKADYKTKQVLADAPSFDFIARWTEKDLPMVKDAYEAVQKIVGHTHELRETAVSQVQMLDRDFKKDKTLEDKFNAVIYPASVAEIDPSNPRALERDPELTRMYEDLGDDGKTAYRRVVDYHEGLRDYQEYLLDKIIKDLPGLDEDTKQNMLTQIYKKFQEERRIEPYLPLVRDTGDFWLAVGEGDNTQIYVYETREQRQEDAERIAQEQYLGKLVGELLETEDFAMINEADELRSRVDIKGSLLSQLFDAIDKRVPETPEQATKLAEANQQLKNDMFDIWLSAMPEQAFRKQFVHRKGRAGYRPDIKRNIATHIARVAPALARLRYGQELRSQQIRLRAAVRSREDLTPFKQSVDKRIDTVLNPRAQTGFWDSFAGAANKLTYLTYLTGAATAFLQPMSIYVSALPILIANHGANPVRVAKELGKMVTYMKQYSTIKTLPDGDIKYTAPTLANNKTLPEDERRAIRAMVSMNVSQQTYSGFLWDAAKGLDDDIVKGKGAKAADLLFNALLRNTERLTREVVYLAAYRLGRQRGLSEQEAIMQAASDVKESLGDYDTMNRPIWMQGPFGRVVFSMKMYPVVVTQQLFGNMYRMIPGLNKEGKKQALIKFSGIVMTTATLAGIYNMPFADLLITMLTKFLEDQDDDDLPDELKDKDPVLWFKTVWMPNKLGEFSIGGVPLDEIIGEGPLTALTGRAVGQRIGLNDLWFRDGKPSPDLATAAQSFMLSFFPFASYGTSALKAVEDFMIGDYQKAMERSVPLATARNFLVANRISKEGFTTPKGELVPPENVTTADVIWQGMGFSPADVAAARETSFKLTGEEQKVLIQRNQLIRKLKFADRKDDDKLMNKVEAEIETFNEKNPEQELTPDQIYQILIAEDEKRAAARAGVVLTDKNTRLFEQSVENLERRLERRQQK